MHTFIELWNIKDSWRALSESDRAAFMEKLGPAIAQLAEQGVTCKGFGFAEEVDHRAPFDFFSVWDCTERKAAEKFEQAVAASGWYDYFEHKNVCGVLQSPEVILKQHIELT
ncbi:DUF6616 family protein [Emcibacter nanhaiensis]|uniref:Uncharacterized protein n=1 Tax=Emcibacter nanhaiensis TaxID=1505037 RepID=A0A501PT10_9PROT|nr:DUF6616 family protein [Emcibacter nanhaiensis]TPD63192.1 hypothetical protein FIV46_03700 [Emcibacter nanhaiensis]